MFRVIFDGVLYRAQCIGDEKNSFSSFDWRVFSAELKHRLEHERRQFEIYAGKVPAEKENYSDVELFGERRGNDNDS